MDAKYFGVTLSNDLEWSKHISTKTNKANSMLSFLRRNLKDCPEKLKQTAYFSLIRSFALLWSMAPLFGTHTKNTTVTKLRGCSVELQGSSKVGIQDTLVFLIYLMSWGGRLFLKGDRRLDLFGFTKLLTVWHKCHSKASLSRRIRVLEENTACNLDRLAITSQSFSLKLLVHGTSLLSLKPRHWLYLDQIFFKIRVHPFRIIPLKGPAEY